MPLHIAARGPAAGYRDAPLAVWTPQGQTGQQGKRPTFLLLEVARILLKHDASLHSEANARGDTPLHLAVGADQQEDEECETDLEEEDGGGDGDGDGNATDLHADADTKGEGDAEGEGTPGDSSNTSSSSSTSRRITDRCAMVSLLLASGARPNRLNVDQDTPLHIAVGHAVCVTLELRACTDTPGGAQNASAGSTGDASSHTGKDLDLDVDRRGGKMQVVQMLSEYPGVYPLVWDLQGWCPIHLAAAAGDEMGVKLLCRPSVMRARARARTRSDNVSELSVRAVVDARTEDGHTPAMLAVRSGHTGVLNLLYRLGANLRLQVPRARSTLLHLGALEAMNRSRSAGPGPRPGAHAAYASMARWLAAP